MKSVKGMRDILPPESQLWVAVEKTFRQICHLYGYEEIRSPIVEPEALFVRSIGEDSDIVHKEMYRFTDPKGRPLVLRPEGTASVARAFIQHRLDLKPKPLRFYYKGPMFRYERPQKGRYRQFYQVGVELLGTEAPDGDGEVIQLLMSFLNALFFEKITLFLNSVGCDACRPSYRQALRDYFSKREDKLCPDCLRRLKTNPLRILDCKQRACQAITRDAPKMVDYLCQPCQDHFAQVKRGLTQRGIPFEEKPDLVRGLDYYTRTVFEVVDEGLGAQNAICGGGRYDGLIASLGGPRVPGIGFAIGEDRLIEVLPENYRQSIFQEIRVYLYLFDTTALPFAYKVSQILREKGIPVTQALSYTHIKNAIKTAESLRCSHIIILGEKEVQEGKVTLKNLATREQAFLDLNEVIPWLQA